MISRTQVDRLGDRLRSSATSDADIRLLDEYRRSFGDAYEIVVAIARDRLGLEPTGRPAKSTSSIIAKLQRESIRLSQIQDIAGCRIIVADVLEQDRVVESLGSAFPGGGMTDRRVHPQFGYRAVHVVVYISGKSVEIQVRSPFQHLWAELSEKMSDVIDPAVKYGGGPAPVRTALLGLSDSVTRYEDLEVRILGLPDNVRGTQEGRDVEGQLRELKDDLRTHLADLIRRFEAPGRPPQ